MRLAARAPSQRAHLDAEHDEAAAARTAELRVRLPALAAGCIAEGNAGHNVSTGPWSGAADGGINRHLPAMLKRQPVAHDLVSSGGVDRHADVHCRQPDIPSSAFACFLAGPGDSALQRQGPKS